MSPSPAPAWIEVFLVLKNRLNQHPGMFLWALANISCDQVHQLKHFAMDLTNPVLEGFGG